MNHRMLNDLPTVENGSDFWPEPALALPANDLPNAGLIFFRVTVRAI